MKRYVSFLLLFANFRPLQAQNRAVPCVIPVSIAERDPLGNISTGFSPKEMVWFVKTVAKRYPMVCYAKQKANEGTWLYISVSTENQTSATATTKTNPDGQGGGTNHTTITPQTTSYPVYTLKVGRFHDGILDVLHTFQRAKPPSGGTVTGLVRSFSNPEHEVILDAVDWLSSAPGNASSPH